MCASVSPVDQLFSPLVFLPPTPFFPPPKQRVVKHKLPKRFASMKVIFWIEHLEFQFILISQLIELVWFHFLAYAYHCLLMLSLHNCSLVKSASYLFSQSAWCSSLAQTDALKMSTENVRAHHKSFWLSILKVYFPPSPFVVHYPPAFDLLHCVPPPQVVWHAHSGPGPDGIGSTSALKSQEVICKFLFPIHFLFLLFFLPLSLASAVLLPDQPIYMHFSTTLCNHYHHLKSECEVQWLNCHTGKHLTNTVIRGVQAAERPNK